MLNGTDFLESVDEKNSEFINSENVRKTRIVPCYLSVAVAQIENFCFSGDRNNDDFFQLYKISRLNKSAMKYGQWQMTN